VLKQAVEDSRGRLSLILVTHGHWDHVGGIEAVRGMYPDAVARKFPGSEPTSTFSPIQPGELIRLGGITLRAIYTPGHATDHLCFNWVEERVLFSGDLVLGQGPVVIPRRGET
jgi:hydrolase